MLVIKPKHTLQSVAKELANGLCDGTIVLRKPVEVLREANIAVSATVTDAPRRRTASAWTTLAGRDTEKNESYIGKAKITCSRPKVAR